VAFAFWQVEFNQFVAQSGDVAPTEWRRTSCGALLRLQVVMGSPDPPARGALWGPTRAHSPCAHA
jgi:hypothetical protein